MPPVPTVAASAVAPFPNPLTLWHLLSLDAPTIAVLWTLFPARLNHIPIPGTTLLATALAVWTLYAADRLLDTCRLPPHPVAISTPHLEPRHLFHHRHRRPFLLTIAAAATLLLFLLPHLLPSALSLYLTEAALLAAYFLLIHTAPPRILPKELLVGLFFSAATFIPTVARAPSLRLTLLPGALLFAALCTLNCLFIYTWEHPFSPHPHASTQAVIRLLPHTAAAILLLALTLAPRRYAAACALSTAALLALHLSRHRLSRLTLRTAADAALLTPLLFL